MPTAFERDGRVYVWLPRGAEGPGWYAFMSWEIDEITGGVQEREGPRAMAHFATRHDLAAHLGELLPGTPPPPPPPAREHGSARGLRIVVYLPRREHAQFELEEIGGEIEAGRLEGNAKACGFDENEPRVEWRAEPADCLET